MKPSYIIKKDANGMDMVKFHFEWTDENGNPQTYDGDDVLEAETIIGLLSGNICIADLTD